MLDVAGSLPVPNRLDAADLRQARTTASGPGPEVTLHNQRTPPPKHKRTAEWRIHDQNNSPTASAQALPLQHRQIGLRRHFHAAHAGGHHLLLALLLLL